MYGSLFVFDSDLFHIVSITFTALIITELIMVGLTVHTWHWAMLCAQVLFESLNFILKKNYLGVITWFVPCISTIN